MKYISFDIETAGLEPGKHSVLEFGAVIDDFETPVDELPTFRRLLDHETIVGNSYALGMHADTGILKELQNGEAEQGGKIIDPKHLGFEFTLWLMEQGMVEKVEDPNVRNAASRQDVLNGDVSMRRVFDEHEGFVQMARIRGSQETFTAAGKNVASFDIPHVRELPNFSEYIQFHHRVLDPGPMYFDPAEDNVVPDLSICLERAGLDDTVDHTAVEDSLDVCRLVRIAKGVDAE